MENHDNRIPVGEKIAYGLGDTAANLVWRTLMVFLPFFYTDVFRISAAAATRAGENSARGYSSPPSPYQRLPRDPRAHRLPLLSH